MKILLLDFSNIAHASFYVISKDRSVSAKTDPFCEERIQYWKYLMLSSIQKQIKTHNPHELVICVDSPSWRKKAFKYYKANREKRREDSDFDYVQFFNNIDNFIEDLKKSFPYKIVRTKFSEADDIIGILTNHLKDDVDQIVISSNDKDMLQLTCNKVKLWSLMKKDWVTVKDPKKYLLQHILMGDSGDGIPNVRSDDDVFINEDKRQKPCGEKTVQKIMEQGIEEWIRENNLIRNWKRNKCLIELSALTIPNKVVTKIIKTYENIEEKPGNYMEILQYMRKNKFRTLENKIDNFLLKKKDKKSILETFDF